MTINATFWTRFTCGALLMSPVFGQQTSNYRARMVTGGDHGKCTIEVDVDDVAEIEIRGDRGVMRTISGSPATWRRLECNQPLPANPRGFRFTGIDGRGDQILLREPSQNRGAALVRIEDHRPGREGYTF